MVKTLATFVLPLTLIAMAAEAQDGSRIRTTTRFGTELPYEVVDGLAVYAGDIILGTAAEVAAWSDEPWRPASRRPTGRISNAVPTGYRQDGSFCLWPDGIVPYIVDDNVPQRERESVLGAIRIYNERTVIRFVAREPQHRDFLRFSLGPHSGAWICQDEGLGEQMVVVETRDSVDNLLHVLGHAIGLEHENQRRDRDRWLTALHDNIAATPLAQSAWHPQLGFGPDIGVYDYRSIMHYRFIEPRKQRNHARPYSAETIPPGMPFGAAGELSPGDVDSMARLYGHIPAEHVIATNPPGLEIVVDGERMTAPASFRWQSGSEHTLEAPSPQYGDKSRFLFGRWSDDGGRVHTVTATRDTTLYQASFIAQHQVSTGVEVRCRDANTTCSPEDVSVTVSPESPDGYYTLRTPIDVTASLTPGSQLRLWRWNSSTDYYAGFLRHFVDGPSSNPVRTFAMSGLTYEAVVGDGPIFRIDSNVDPVQVSVGDWWGETPIVFDGPERFAGSTTVGPRLRDAVGRAYRHRFRRWSDGGDETHTIDVPRDTDSTLTLTLDTEYRLTTRAWQDWYGNEILTTPSSADGFYPEGTEVRLLASAKPPAKFIGWNGDVAGRDPAALVVMSDGKLAEAVFALDATELQTDVPVDVSLHGVRWNGTVPDFRRHYIEPPPDASEIEVEFRTRVSTPGEAGLFVAGADLWPNRVRQGTADLVLRAGEVRTMTISRPPAERWPPAYFILVRATESDSIGTPRLEGTLVARIKRYGDGNRLVGGQRLRPGQFIEARAAACRLSFQTDGNLVASKNRVAYWSAGTQGATGLGAVMQSDGNFVVRDADGVARWSTGTRSPGAFLVIQNDCNVVLRSAGGAALWATGRP